MKWTRKLHENEKKKNPEEGDLSICPKMYISQGMGKEKEKEEEKGKEKGKEKGVQVYISVTK
jgi:hypothetical protein